MVDPLKISYQFYDIMDEDIREVGKGNVHVLHIRQKSSASRPIRSVIRDSATNGWIIV